MRVRLLSGLLSLVTALSLALPANPVAAAEPFCGDVQLVWAGGTGRDIADDPQFQFLNRELVGDAQVAGRIGPTIAYSGYQIGQDNGFGGFKYPAAGSQDFFTEWTDTISNAYTASVEEGRGETVAYLTHRATECPGEFFLLAGWSQGAQLVRESLFLLSSATRNRIAHVALFGDPTYSTTDAAPGCLNNDGPWLRGTAPCFAGGIFGTATPYLPADLTDNVGSWCRAGDASCTSLPPDLLTVETEHKKYFDPDGMAAMAMREAVDALEEFIPAQANDLDKSFLQFATGNAGADLVFIFDTTGSMSGSIANAKTEATELANYWLTISTNGRVALVEFRDHGDQFVSRVVQQLTNDQSAFQTAVNSLVASGGGDTPEAQLSGVMTALDSLAWKNGATKIGIVITDAPGKDPEPNTAFTRAQVSQHALEIDPVAVYGVSVINNVGVTGFMQPMADATAGEVFVLGQGQTLSDLLADVMDSIAMSPVANLGGPYFAATGGAIEFSAERSFDPDGTLASFKWDFDGNGTTDQTTNVPTVNHTYTAPFGGFAAVRVVSSDGGEALATAAVTVDAAGLANDVPVAPTAGTAAVTGSGQVTVSWTPAANDRADGYYVMATDNLLTRFVPAGGANSVAISGLDLTGPRTFEIRASNEFGTSDSVTTSPVGGAAAVTTQLVSISTSRAKGNGASLDAYVDADARRVVFHSDATNLAAGDTNNQRDIFVRDRVASTTTLVSASVSGTVGNGASQDPAISKNGRYVAFRSQASNLVSGDTNGTSWDIFVKDLQTGTVDRVSVSTAGAQANGASQNPMISADGRFVTYRSSATNLVSGDTNGQPDIFVRDRQTNTTTRVSVVTAGAQATGGVSDEPAISDDGRFVAFQSDATNLVTGDTNAKTDIFRHDRQTNTTIRISVSSSGAQSNNVSTDPALNGDGSRVVWESIATNLVSGDTNAKEDVFVRLVATNETIRVSVSSAGAQTTSASNDASLSTSGTKVAFYSTATNLVSGDTNSRGDVFIRDLGSNTTDRVSLTASGTQINEASSGPWISGDGSATAFASIGTNVVPADTDATSDVYIRGPGMAN